MPVRGNRGVIIYTRKPPDLSADISAIAARLASPASARFGLLLQVNTEKPQSDTRHFYPCETFSLRTDFSPRTASAVC